MTISDLVDYLGQFPPDTRVVLNESDITAPCEFISLSELDYSQQPPSASDGTETPDGVDIPHASDCAVWVNEPCDCITGKDVL